jgi:hypothetical protein
MAAFSFMCFFDGPDLDILCNPAPVVGAVGELRRGTFPGHGQLDPNMRMKSLDDCFERLSDFDWVFGGPSSPQNRALLV